MLERPATLACDQPPVDSPQQLHSPFPNRKRLFVDNQSKWVRYCKPCKRGVRDESGWEIHINGRWHKEQVAYIDSPPRVLCDHCRDERTFPHYECPVFLQRVCCDVCQMVVPVRFWKDHLNDKKHRDLWANVVDDRHTMKRKCNDCEALVLPVLWKNHVVLHRNLHTSQAHKTGYNGSPDSVMRREKANVPIVSKQQEDNGYPAEGVGNENKPRNRTGLYRTHAFQSGLGKRCFECDVTISRENPALHELGREHISNLAVVDAPPRVRCRGCDGEFALPTKHECEGSTTEVHCRICDRNVPFKNWKQHISSPIHFERLKVCAKDMKRCDTCDVKMLRALWPDHVKAYRHPAEW